MKVREVFDISTFNRWSFCSSFDFYTIGGKIEFVSDDKYGMSLVFVWCTGFCVRLMSAHRGGGMPLMLPDCGQPLNKYWTQYRPLNYIYIFRLNIICVADSTSSIRTSSSSMRILIMWNMTPLIGYDSVFPSRNSGSDICPVPPFGSRTFVSLDRTIVLQLLITVGHFQTTVGQ